MRKGRPSTTQNFTMTGSNQQSNAFGAQTYMIRIATGAQPGYFLVSADPTASSSTAMIGANIVDYITVNPGQKIGVLQAGTGGVISVTELE
jgi:hypothetical protein